MKKRDEGKDECEREKKLNTTIKSINIGKN